MKLFEAALVTTLSYTLVCSPALSQDDDRSVSPAEAPAEATSQPAESAVDAASSAPQRERRRKDADEPGAPPKGTGKLVGGIVAASVGTGIGLLSLIAGSIDCDDIDKDNANTTDEAKKADREKQVKDCKDQQPALRTAGGIFLAAGLGVGLPLIYFGIQDRKAYNAWKGEQAFRPGQANLIVLADKGRAGFIPGLSVSYNF